MQFGALTGVLILLQLSLVATVDYCELCRTPGSHTMCKFPDSGPRSPCSPLPLSDDEKNRILSYHNERRNEVALGKGKNSQPPAANMMILSWDSELATIAERWINQCEFGHDQCRDSERFPVGQNIALTVQSDEALVENMAMWFNEIDIFDPSGVDSFSFSKETGHYTQMVWARTALIGCARVQASDRGMQIARLYCNYGRSGNVRNQPLYTVGEARSACPEDSSASDSAYPGLCVNPAMHRSSSPRTRINAAVILLAMRLCL